MMAAPAVGAWQRRLLAALVVTVWGVSGCGNSDSHADRPHRHRPPPVRYTAAPSVPTPATAGSNQARAVAAAARAIRDFPVPSGSTPFNHVPAHAPGLRHLRAQIQAVDPSLTRTRWWLVRRPYLRVVAWYAAHTPADPRSTYGPGKSKPRPEGQLFWETHGPAKTHSPPAKIVAYARLGSHLTALRTDVTLAARSDRTADTLVPVHLTELTITKQAIDGPDTSPTTVKVTNPGRLNDVVAAFNSTQGAYANTESAPCGSPAAITYYYSMTFTWPGHTLHVDAGQPLCGRGRTLTLNGTLLPQTLAIGSALSTALKAAFDTA